MSRWIIAAGVLAAASALAQGFVRTVASSDGTKTLCVTWDHRDLTYHPALEGSSRIAGDAEFTAIEAAFGTWQALSDACSDFQFREGARVSAPRVGPGSQDANVVVFRERACAEVAPPDDACWSDGSCGNAYACWNHSSSVIGLTSVTFSKRTGIAVDADVELNNADFLFTTVDSPPCAESPALADCVAYDVQNTLTHEIGHVLGFDHVADPDSTMAPTAPLGETRKRIIDLGTADGFCSTYPRGQPPVPCEEQLRRRVVAQSVGTFGCSCSQPAAGPGAAALGLIALGWWRAARGKPGRRAWRAGPGPSL